MGMGGYDPSEFDDVDVGDDDIKDVTTEIKGDKADRDGIPNISCPAIEESRGAGSREEIMAMADSPDESSPPSMF
jgi:hypothetical protein